MTNITHEVWRMLDNDPSIRRELHRGLINTSALARYLILLCVLVSIFPQKSQNVLGFSTKNAIH